MPQETRPIIRANMEQIRENSADAFHCLLNEILHTLQSVTDKNKFRERLSYLVLDTLANWHDLTATCLLKRIIYGGLGENFSFDSSASIVKELGQTEVTLEQLIEYACDQIRRQRGNHIGNPEYLDVPMLRLAFPR